MSASADALADEILADAAAQMLGAQQVASGGGGGSQPTAADMAAAMAMAAAAGLSPEEMAELAGGGGAPTPQSSSSFDTPSADQSVALSPRTGVRLSRLAQERTLSLALRTSLLCEFRDASGLLQAFEVCYGQTTFGVLCAALERMPGIQFLDHESHRWFRRPSEFTFKGELYEVSIPYDNIRVAPVDHGKALIEMEELLEYVRHNVLRARESRYTLR